ATALREDVTAGEGGARFAALFRAVGERGKQRGGKRKVRVVQKAGQFDRGVRSTHAAAIEREEHRFTDHCREAAIARLRPAQVGLIGDGQRFQTPGRLTVERTGTTTEHRVRAYRFEETAPQTVVDS